MLIDGELTPGQAGNRLECVNPFDGKVFATVPDASDGDIDAAFGAARDAFNRVWSRTPGVERARLLNRLADLLTERADEIAALESTDNGKPITETTSQAHFSARLYRFYAGYADKLYGRQLPLDAADRLDYTVREPLGVVVLITAWNSPMQLLANKLAPALAAGNCVVVKPSEHASVTTLELGRLCVEAGFPAGVINIVSGGPGVGRRLTSLPDVGRISFTGSVETGQAIARAAAQNLIPCTLELGGKSPNIVFDDADLDQAVAGAMVGIFSAGGQTCIAGSRLLVHRAVYDEVVDRLSRRAAKIRLGNPLDPQTQMGPVANRPQFERVEGMIGRALEEGSHRTTEVRELPPDLDAGLFVQPTIFVDVDMTMEIARHEVFGPVLSIIPFGDDDEAVEVANSTEYGLASGVWTESLSRAHSVARRLVAGTVWVNTYREAAAQAPFGGVRKSGYGRERGEEALDEFLRTKNVLVNLSGVQANPFA